MCKGKIEMENPPEVYIHSDRDLRNGKMHGVLNDNTCQTFVSTNDNECYSIVNGLRRILRNPFTEAISQWPIFFLVLWWVQK